MGGGTIPLAGCIPCANVDIGIVCATEKTAVVCIGPLWTAVVVNNLLTAPVVGGVCGVEYLTVAVLLTKLVVVTLVCVDVATPATVKCFNSDVANTDCGMLCRLSVNDRDLPILEAVTGMELTVEALESVTDDILVGIAVIFLVSDDLTVVCVLCR